MKFKGRHLNLFISLILTLIALFWVDLPYFIRVIDITVAGFNWIVWFVCFKDATELTYKEPEGFKINENIGI
jgi:hypothetical protein